MHVPEPIIRVARLDDVEAIADIWHHGWMDVHHGHVPAALAAHRSRADLPAEAARRLESSVVAVVGGEIAGFVVVHLDELEHLYVSARVRGTGVAELLLAHAEGSIAARHRTGWLAVVAANTRARRFYERNGWTSRGAFDHMAKVDNGAIAVTAVRYEKTVAR